MCEKVAAVRVAHLYIFLFVWNWTGWPVNWFVNYLLVIFAICLGRWFIVYSVSVPIILCGIWIHKYIPYKWLIFKTIQILVDSEEMDRRENITINNLPTLKALALQRSIMWYVFRYVSIMEVASILGSYSIPEFWS